jgi:hypothetical protein
MAEGWRFWKKFGQPKHPPGLSPEEIRADNLRFEREHAELLARLNERLGGSVPSDEERSRFLHERLYPILETYGREYKDPALLYPDDSHTNLLLGLRLHAVSSELQGQVVGHGITRGNIYKNTESLLNLLDGEKLIGDTGALKDDQWMSAYTDSSADYVVVGHASNNAFYKKDGTLDIAAVLVNGKGLPFLEALRARYPSVTFLDTSLPEEAFAREFEKAVIPKNSE